MLKNILAATAAAGLAFAPIAAQANTRASDAGVSLASIDRAGAPVVNAEELGGEFPVALIIALFGGAALALILAVQSGNGEAATPGI